MTKKPKYIRILLSYILIFCAALIYTLIRYKNSEFGEIGIDELQFYVFNGLGGANMGTFSSAVANYAPIFITAFLILILPTINVYDQNIRVTTSLKVAKRKFINNFYPSKIISKYLIVYASAIFVISLIFAGSSLHFVRYLSSITSKSSFFENSYVDPRKVKLTFPDKKPKLNL